METARKVRNGAESEKRRGKDGAGRSRGARTVKRSQDGQRQPGRVERPVLVHPSVYPPLVHPSMYPSAMYTLLRMAGYDATAPAACRKVHIRTESGRTRCSMRRPFPTSSPITDLSTRAS